MRLTLLEFIRYLHAIGVPFCDGRDEIHPCHCGDVNCKGWKIQRFTS